MKKLLACLLLLSILSLVLVACEEPAETPTDDTPDVPADPPATEPEVDDPVTQPAFGDLVNEPVKTPTMPEGAVNVVTDWGVSTDAGKGIDNGLILYQNINALKRGSTVFFPAGTYEIDLPMTFTNKENIRVVGEGAVILNTRATNTAASQPASDDSRIPSELRDATATSGMVWIEGCKNITFEGLTFRYACPTSLSGKITATTNTYADIEVTDGSPITGDECVMAFNTFTSDGIPDKALELYETFRIEKRSDTTLRIFGNKFQNLPQNTCVCLRTSLSSNYIFTVFNSSDLTFQDLILNNSLNGGFLIEHRTVNATFRRVHVKSHHENALFSLNADALHIAGLGGTLTIDDCHFERGGDDFINIHAVAAKPESITGNTLTYTLSWGKDSRWAAKGDTIEFFHPTTFATLGTAKVASVSGTTLTFDALPTGVTTSSILSNKTLHPKVQISATTARYNRARAFLIQTDEVNVTNCTFYGTTLAALLFAPDVDNWMEVSPARKVDITSCLFELCGTDSVGMIQFSSDHDNADKVYSTKIHSDICISNNIFKNSRVPALYAVNCKNLTFRGNQTEDLMTARYQMYLISCETVRYGDIARSDIYAKNTADITVEEQE